MKLFFYSYERSLTGSSHSYPPDFDPSKIVRHKGPKPTGPKQQTVRLMAPFSMKCLSCGEFIYKGRKFNARKEHSGESKNISLVSSNGSTADKKFQSITILAYSVFTSDVHDALPKSRSKQTQRTWTTLARRVL